MYLQLYAGDYVAVRISVHERSHILVCQVQESPCNGQALFAAICCWPEATWLLWHHMHNFQKQQWPHIMWTIRSSHWKARTELRTPAGLLCSFTCSLQCCCLQMACRIASGMALRFTAQMYAHTDSAATHFTINQMHVQRMQPGVIAPCLRCQVIAVSPQ